MSIEQEYNKSYLTEILNEGVNQNLPKNNPEVEAEWLEKIKADPNNVSWNIHFTPKLTFALVKLRPNVFKEIDAEKKTLELAIIAINGNPYLESAVPPRIKEMPEFQAEYEKVMANHHPGAYMSTIHPDLKRVK